MQKKQFFLLFFLSMGLIFIIHPQQGNSFASNKAEKGCCAEKPSTQKEKKTEKKECCKDKDAQQKAEDDSHSPCGSSDCKCDHSGQITAISKEVLHLSEKIYFSIVSKKVPLTEKVYASAFRAIWLPPKIA